VTVRKSNATSKGIEMSILLRIFGSILLIYGVAHIIRISNSYTPYDAYTIIQFLFLQAPDFLLFIFPGLAVLWVDAAIAKRKEKQESGNQRKKKSNKTLENVAIIAKSFLLAVGIFMLIFYLSFFVPGNNLGPINGVILGSIVSLPLFVLLLVAWILRAQGFTKMRAYSIAFAVVCLTPVIYSAVAFTIHLIR
jgi:hypothetical protein